jgi:ABC-2 type transport system permease protein/lipopolysaccharide transport system permease protein
LLTGAATSPLARALHDLSAGFRRHELWRLVAWNEIRQHYHRSIIGPFWLTLSMAIMIAGLGVVYAKLWQTPVQAYLPHLAIGLVFWSLISAILLDGCQIFISKAGLIRQLHAPLSLYAYQMLFRNLIIFAHHLLIIVVVLPLCGVSPGWQAMLALPGLLLLAINGLWASLALGMLCARYRDVPQIMLSLVQILFFLTPVIWTAERLTDYGLVLQLNPLHHLLELVRAPLLGRSPALESWIVASGLALAGSLLTALSFGRHRGRIAYWV